MKMNSKNLDELINRYFDAETTLEEERELQRLITGPFASDTRYDEVRAVMGFTAVGGAHARRCLYHSAGSPRRCLHRLCQWAQGDEPRRGGQTDAARDAGREQPHRCAHAGEPTQGYV